MDDVSQPPTVEEVSELLDARAYDDVTACLRRFETAPADDRRGLSQELQRVGEETPDALAPVVPALVRFLTDAERSVRLTTAKTFVAVAKHEPDAVALVAPALAERLADDEEFYYVRARSAEALGYVALDHPDSVTSPELMADLQIGLSFDEPEVKRKLAKALEHVSLGDPNRLAHRVSKLTDHLDDDDELVRYHLCTALVAVGCANPEKIGEATDALTTRLDDECDHVQGRAAEALGLLTRTEEGSVSPEATSLLEDRCADELRFVRERAAFALDSIDDHEAVDEPNGEIGTLDGVRRTTEAALNELTSPDEENVCPNCGLALPDAGPPLCPGCGMPR
ncbi:HEAT repeat domain-containing protein [Haladaptatus sp.]|uniref:HEAT repeat domain-containing protein n=1 Tax=Haladaptatus sp. TaxID=1973141 RepID=UPI003C3B4F7A